jgi:hypothetical protein
MTLTENDIVTERKPDRRSFLSQVGALLIGAVAIVGGRRSSYRMKSPNDSDDEDQKSDSKDSDESRLADPHLPGDHNDSGWDDPDSDMRTWADKKDSD